MAKFSDATKNISEGVAAWALHTAQMSKVAAAAAGQAAKWSHEAQLSATHSVQNLQRLVSKERSKALAELPEEEDVPSEDPPESQQFDDGLTAEERQEEADAKIQAEQVKQGQLEANAKEKAEMDAAEKEFDLNPPKPPRDEGEQVKKHDAMQAGIGPLGTALAGVFAQSVRARGRIFAGGRQSVFVTCRRTSRKRQLADFL
mmetsp:Transcript_90638/g.142220  ORF Transcript_90638/g.142220 Transcript_90638/m.142220 type:complete len:202 (-) Transcript_90638:150-755(-)